MMSGICDQIAQGLGALFVCERLGGFERIRTPFLYPDGDVIDVFYDARADHASVTDLGETLRWLRGQTISAKLTKKQRQLLEDICLTNGVELFRGMLITRIRDGEEISIAVLRVAQAAVRVADIWFTFRTRSVESISDEVEDLLVENNIPYERSEPIVGRSGRVWRPDFHTRHVAKSSLVYVLSTNSRAVAKSVTEHVVASWFDLNHLKVGPSPLDFISLVDDTADVWTEENIKLLGDISDVAYWSHPDALVDKLAA